MTRTNFMLPDDLKELIEARKLATGDSSSQIIRDALIIYFMVAKNFSTNGTPNPDTLDPTKDPTEPVSSSIMTPHLQRDHPDYISPDHMYTNRERERMDEGGAPDGKEWTDEKIRKDKIREGKWREACLKHAEAAKAAKGDFLS